MGSWAWRKLLKMRPLAYDFLRYKLHDGRSVSFWQDNWLGSGKLLDATGDLGIRYLGVARNATISNVLSEAGWNIRSRGQRRYPEVYAMIDAFPVSYPLVGADVVLWRNDQNEFKPSFSSARTWNHLRNKRDKVGWRKLVWFGQAVPRHSFMTWLTFLNRPSTGDRMKKWGIEQRCMLCGEPNETRDHLFFACPYLFMVWMHTAGKLLGAAITPDWSDTVDTLLQFTISRVDSVLRRMVFQTVLYAIWMERNSRRHGGGWVTVEKLSQKVYKMLRNCISSLCFRGSHPL